MARNTTSGEKALTETRIDSLEALINLNLRTLEQVIDNSIDNKKAALIFTGSRTVTSTLKVGLEAMKLGLAEVSGVSVSDNERLPLKSPK